VRSERGWESSALVVIGQGGPEGGIDPILGTDGPDADAGASRVGGELHAPGVGGGILVPYAMLEPVFLVFVVGGASLVVPARSSVLGGEGGEDGIDVADVDGDAATGGVDGKVVAIRRARWS